MAAHNELGRWGEDVAADYLQRKGYVIVARDWKSGHRDLDIVAINEARDTMVFVEVKTRRNRIFADPEEAVGYQKIRNLQLAANHYIKYHRVDLDVRFDIVTVTGTPAVTPFIEHIEDAF